MTIAALRDAYRRRTLTVAAKVADTLARIAAWNDPALWISRPPADAVLARAHALDALDADAAGRLALFGVPFAVKDNIDVAGLPTTAACPDFAYEAAANAPVVERLLEAGAVFIGKTNLDQFATGLVGTRSPHGMPRNAVAPRFIPGGSSSGSAAAVAAGLVSFALGTDTAGSGRVPAAFNNIVGLKPTRGLVSTRGVVPACRSLDCVSIFAATAADARTVLDVIAAFDAADPFSRPAPDGAAADAVVPFRFGVPAPEEREFFGDREYARLYEAAIARCRAAGGTEVTIALAPFCRVGALLYSGPFVAERLEAPAALLARKPDALMPVTRTIIERGLRYSALDTFRAFHDLIALRRETEASWHAADVLLLPTAGTIFTPEEIAADPLRRNVQLGHYTNFVNLLDLSAIAFPAGVRGDGAPFGVTLMAPAFADRRLAALAARLAQA
jgi:allophanate hydrolase